MVSYGLFGTWAAWIFFEGVEHICQPYDGDRFFARLERKWSSNIVRFDEIYWQFWDLSSH
jgi:hypothetical protein